MDWNDYLTVIFGCLAAILTIIQIYQVLPKKTKLSFSEIKVTDMTSKVSSVRELIVRFRAENIGNKDNEFDITAKLVVFFEEKKYTFDIPKKIQKMEIKSKDSTSLALVFEIPLGYDTWNNPKVQFTYSYIKGDRIITKNSRWEKGIRG